MMSKIRIKLMKEEAYKTLQNNSKDVFEYIKKYPSKAVWLNEFLGYDPYIEKTYKIDDFELKYNKNYNEVSWENSYTIYSHLKELPRYILSNNLFWAWILFEKFYKQAQVAIEFNPSVISTRWLIRVSRRDLMLGVASRQFFKIDVSFAEDENDKYSYSKFIIDNHNPYKNIAMRNIGMLKNVALPYFKICKEAYEKYNVILNDKFCSSLMKEASKIGSVMLIEDLSEEEVYDILSKKMIELIKETK